MTNENAEEFWSRIKNLIKQNNTTQDWLAQKCDVSINVLKSWIFNKRLPDAAQASKIAQALGTSVEYLVTGSDNSPYMEENAQLKDRIQKAVEILTN